MEKHEQNYTSAKKPRAKVQSTLKANRVDPAESARSRQEGINRQSCCDELRRGRQSGWLDARPGVTADVHKGGF